MRVLIPKHPRSVHYHRDGCGSVDHDAAATVARGDAELLGYRAHSCLNTIEDPDADEPREVTA